MAEANQRLKRVQRIVLAGAFAGFIVLGVGGRLLMRAVAFTAAEAPRFSFGGTFEVVGLGMLWGAATAPLLLLIGRAQRDRRFVTGVIHGMLVFVAAVAVFLVLSGGGARIVAPPLFIVSSAVLFPLLFVAHGCAVLALAVRWMKW